MLISCVKEQMFFEILVVFCLLVCSFFYLKYIRPGKEIYDALRQQGIPGERFVPLIGQALEIRRYREEGRLLEYHEKLRNKHGFLYLFNLGPYPRLLIQDADLIADVLGRNRAENFYKPADLAVRLKSLLGVHSLLITNGQEHERARKMLNPAFHFDNLRSMISIITDQTSRAIDKLLQQQTPATKFNLAHELNGLTLSIIAACAFGESSETISSAQELISRTFASVISAIAYRTSRMIPLIPLINQLPFWKKDLIDHGTKEMNDFVDQIITNRRQGQSQSLCAGSDLLDLLLSASDNQGQSFTNEEIKDQTLTFILAGHETTSNLITWVFFELMNNPSVYQACREEVDRLLPAHLLPTSEHLTDLVVLDAVLQETLRLYPPAPFFARQCLREQTIGTSTDHPIRLPSGATVLINVYGIHRREEYWSRANDFDYKRWLRDPQTGLKPKLSHPFCYLPFAAGPRNCIGQNFALLESKILLAMFIQRCHFQLEPGQTILPEIRLTMRPKDGLFARVTSRKATPWLNKEFYCSY